MKLQLTEKAINELNLLFENEKFEYDEYSEYEQLLADANLYVDGAYTDNEFEDLNEWCIETGSSEYEQTYLNTHPNVVREKIDLMLKENIITIIK
jgi:hypothetical protein